MAQVTVRIVFEGGNLLDPATWDLHPPYPTGPYDTDSGRMCQGIYDTLVYHAVRMHAEERPLVGLLTSARIAAVLETIDRVLVGSSTSREGQRFIEVLVQMTTNERVDTELVGVNTEAFCRAVGINGSARNMITSAMALVHDREYEEVLLGGRLMHEIWIDSKRN